MKTSAVAGLPTPFKAVHRYDPAACLLIFLNGTLTTRLSLVHVTFAWGLPRAEQMRLTVSPSSTVVLGDMKVIFGGPKNIYSQTIY